MTTREAALKSCKDRLEHLEKAPSHHCGKRQRQRAIELEKVKIEALRPITREQVEMVWRGGWKCQSDCGVTECTACKWNIEEYCGDYNFCPHCGAPMNDEAIQMVMERMKELKRETF